MQKSHSIKQQRFHISTADQNLSREVFDETSRLFNTYLQQVTEEVFDTLVDKKRLVYIDTLELNIGSVTFPYSVTELVNTYREALEAALMAQLKELQVAGHVDTGGPSPNRIREFSYRAVLEQYLFEGIIAAWVRDFVQAEPEWLFNQSAGEDSTGLSTHLKIWILHRPVRQRLVYNFSEAVVIQTLRLIEPSQAEYIIYYHREVAVLQHEQQIANVQETDFRKALWMFILDFLADQSGSMFNRKMFARQTLLALAAHYNIEFERLLYYLSTALNDLPDDTANRHELLMIIREIADDEKHSELWQLWNEPAANPTATKEKQTALLEEYLYFLAFGFFRLPGQVSENDLSQALFMRWLDKAPDRAAAYMRQYGKEVSFRRRVWNHLGETAIRKIVQSVEPAHATEILEYVDRTTGLQQQHRLIQSAEQEFRRTLWELVLLFLLADRGSVFNLRVFIESHVRAMAAHFNMEFKTLLACLVQEIGQFAEQVSDRTSLFHILMEILRGDEVTRQESRDVQAGVAVKVKKNLEKPAEELVDGAMRDPESPEYRLFRRNALVYWLEHAELPWWAETLNRKPEALFQNMVETDPAEAALILKTAVASGKLSIRVFRMHETLILKILSHFDSGKQAVAVYQAMRGFLNFAEDRGTLQFTLMYAWTEAFLGRWFERIQTEKFILSFFAAVKKSMSSTAYQQLVRGFETYISTNTIPESQRILKQIQYTGEFRQQLAMPVYAYSESDVLSILEMLIAGHSVSARKLTSEEAAIQLLEQIFTDGRLPLELAYFTNDEMERLVRALALFVYKRYRHALVNLFEKPGVSQPLKLKLFEIILENKTTEYTGLHQLIRPYAVKAWRTLARESRLTAATEAVLFRELLAGIHRISASSERVKQWTYYLQIPSFRTYIATELGQDAFIEILKLFPDQQLRQVYQQLLFVFSALGTDVFERRQFMIWIREFMGLLLTQDLASISKAWAIQRFLHFVYHRKRIDLQKIHVGLQGLYLGLSQTEREQYGESLEAATLELKAMTTLETERHEIQAAQKTNEQSLQDADKLAYLAKQNSEKDTMSDQTDKLKKKYESGEHIPVQQAGLVLLHPFLTVLFERAGCIENGVWRSAATKAKAVQLLQYAATGHETIEEHTVVIHKLLCGMEPNDFLENPVPLTEEERMLVDGLLNALIQRWDKMQSSSVENLRASFLMREGTLASHEDLWKLRVEHKAYDILLQTLPWGISYIKAAWMHKPLTVEWI